MLRHAKVGLEKASLYLHRFNCLTALPCLVSLVFYDVAVRTLGLHTPPWSHEVSGLFLLTIFFCSLPHCYMKNEFLSVDFLYQHLSQPLKQSSQFISYSFALGFAAILSWQSFSNAKEMYYYEEEAYTIAIPLWPFSAIVCISAALIALIAITQILDKLWQLKQA